MSDVTKCFADRLSDLIEESGKPFRDLAKEIGISTGSLSKYQYDAAVAGVDALAKISAYFDVSSDWLLGLSDVKSVDIDIKGISKKTGLSEKAATFLKRLNDDAFGAHAKRYTVQNYSVLDDLMISDLFSPFLGELGLYFIYGGGLPSDAYGDTTQDISDEEITRFYEWANGQGLEVIARKDVSEMHLQKACDILKDIAKECLEQQIRNLQENTDSH